MALMSCPDRESLQRLLQGRIPAAKSEELEEHLLHCDTCSTAGDSLTVNDEIIDAVRNRRVFEGDEDILAEAIQRGKQLRGEVETVDSIEETATFDIRDQTPDSVGEVNVNMPTPESIDFLHPPQQSDEIGRLGDYRVLEVLGVVFRAEDPKLERLIALKAMKPDIAASELAKDRFLREAKATAAIDHDNIVHIYQVGEDANVPFIATQFLRGESLQTRLKREGKLDQHDVVRIGREVAAGLAAAHKRDLIHRDIKPDNIWIDEESGRAKILDFGLVRTTTDESDLTQSGTVLGTPRYMAPEQALGQEVDLRCDLFSLGSVLYHLAVGKVPFDGSNITAILIAVAHKEPAPLQELCSNLGADLADLIMRLLQKDPGQRPQSAAEVAAALSEVEKKLDNAQVQDLADAEVIETTQLAVPQIVTETPVKAHIGSRSVADKSSKRKRVRPVTQGGRAPLLTRPRVVVTGALAVVLIIFLVLWAAGVIFKVETPSCTLVVEVEGNNFETNLKGKTLTIKDTSSDETYEITLDHEQVARPLEEGVYEFILRTESGLKVSTDRFEIKGDENSRVKVRWELRRRGNPEDSSEAGEERSFGEPLIQFCWCPAGKFTMGSPADEAGHQRKNEDQVDVTLTHGYWLGQHEVTQGQWKTVMSTTPWKGATYKGENYVKEDSDCPAVYVNWDDAMSFCQKLT